MNKTTALVLVVLLALISLGLWSSTPGAQEALPTPVVDVATTTPTVESAEVPVKPVANAPSKAPAPAPFRSIFTQAGSHECKYEQVTATGRNSNVVYIADGKMRGEFRTVSGGSSAGDMMVYNNGYLYVWKEGKTTGIKTPISSVSELPHTIPSDLTSGAVIGTNTNNVSWDCHTWIQDKALLAPPSYVTFSSGR